MKYLFIIILFLSSLLVMSQKTKEDVYYQYEQKQTSIGIKFHTQVDWTTENENEWGSFKWCVIRTYRTDNDGVYWYYVYLYSNSFFNIKDRNEQYQKAITYISDLHVYMTDYCNNVPVMVYDYYIAYTTCDHYKELDPALYVAVFSSKSKINTFGVKFSECSPFHDSKLKK